VSDSGKLKSAYELAMERLRAQDREGGVEQARPLGDEQKKTIARLRQEAKAKLAELEILLGKRLAGAGDDPAKLTEIEEQYQIDRRRVESTLESAIARIKRGEAESTEA
jgi:hypothetical protein